MPLVDGKYRTLPGQPNTGIGGSSFGGVATLYALLAQPGRFGYGLIESPTLWIGRPAHRICLGPATAGRADVPVGDWQESAPPPQR